MSLLGLPLNWLPFLWWHSTNSQKQRSELKLNHEKRRKICCFCSWLWNCFRNDHGALSILLRLLVMYFCLNMKFALATMIEKCTQFLSFLVLFPPPWSCGKDVSSKHKPWTEEISRRNCSRLHEVEPRFYDKSNFPQLSTLFFFSLFDLERLFWIFMRRNE
jgi:hypothetical protein